MNSEVEQVKERVDRTQVLLLRLSSGCRQVTLAYWSPIKRTANVIGWLAIGLFLNEHVVSLATVSGRSMQPTLNPDSSKLKRDIVILNRLAALRPASYWRPGDVVALKSPIDPDSLVIKRLIGLPGSIVRAQPNSQHGKNVRIPPGKCWVEGDEPFHSRDSNSYGPIPLALIDAKVDYVIWPPSRFGSIKKKDQQELALRVFVPTSI